MKTALLVRTFGFIAAAAALVGGGYWIARLNPPRQNGMASVSNAGAVDSKNPSPSAEGADRAAAAAFDGTLAGLLRMAKETGPLSRANAMLYLVLEPLPPAKIAELTKSFPQTGERSGYEKAVLTALLQQWTAKDAAGALKWAGGLSRNRRAEVRLEILRTLAATDPDQAVKLTNTMVPAPDRDTILVALVEVIAEADPEKALRMLLSSNRARNHTGLSAIFQSWARRDPEGAWSKALSLRRSDMGTACATVLKIRAGTDPAAALTLALGLKKPMSAWCASAVLTAWEQSDPAGARAAVLSLPAGPERDSALDMSINAKAATDAPGALLDAQALPKGARRDNLIKRVYEMWAMNDPPAAAAALASTPLSARQKQEVVSNLFSAWGERDPQAAMEGAKGLSVRDGQTNALNSALYFLSAADPAAAVASWKSLTKEQQRTHLPNLLGNWASGEPGAAMAFARSLENAADRATALSCCASSVCTQQPEALAALLSELPAGPLRANTIVGIMGDAYGGGPAEVPAWLRALPEADRTAALRSAYSSTDGFSNPEEMKALLAETPGLGDQTRLWETTAKSLAREHPASALEWALAIESPTVRRNSIDAVLQEWARENPSAALAQAHALTDAETQKSSVRNVIEIWASSEPQAVLAWAAGAEGEEREMALLKGSLANAAYDPVVSAKVINELVAGKSEGGGYGPVTGAASQVARAWFYQSIPESTAWAAQLPEGGARSMAMVAIVGQWTRLDPVAASAWVKPLPAGDSRDAAAFTLSQGIQYSDPESAFAWAASIANAGQRDEALRAAAAAWSTQDRPAARAAVLTAPLSETVRATVLENIDKKE
jgi:hypothetical protein